MIGHILSKTYHENLVHLEKHAFDFQQAMTEASKIFEQHDQIQMKVTRSHSFIRKIFHTHSKDLEYLPLSE